MQQTPEAQAFIDRILALPKGPGQPLDDVLQPSVNDETELRRLFATEKNNSRLSDIHVGLVDIFDAPEDIRTTRARVVENNVELSAQYVIPLPEARRRKEGELAVVSSLDGFKKNWAIFTEGSLSQLLDWDNVIAAGGSVLACLAPLPESAKASKRAVRKYYHGVAYPSSDIDLFLYGMTPEQVRLLPCLISRFLTFLLRPKPRSFKSTRQFGILSLGTAPVSAQNTQFLSIVSELKYCICVVFNPFMQPNTRTDVFKSFSVCINLQQRSSPVSM